MKVTFAEEAVSPSTGPPPSPLRRRLTFIVVLSSALAASLIFSVIHPIMPMLARHFGGRDGIQSAQMAIIMPNVGLLAAGALSGWILAQFGTRQVILVTLAGFGAAGVYSGLSPDAFGFFSSRLVLGACSALLSTACVTLLAELYRGEARNKAVGVLEAVLTFSSIPVVVASGAIAEAVGWRAPFVFYGVFALPMFLLALAVVRRDPPRAAARAAASALAAVSVWGLWPIFLLIMAAHNLPTMQATQFPFLLVEDGVGRSTGQAMLMVPGGVVMGTASLASGYVQSKLGERGTFLLAITSCGLGFLLIGSTHAPAFAMAGSMASALGGGLLLPLYYTLIVNRTTAEERGKAVGFVQASKFLGSFLNPFLLAPLRQALGMHGVYLTVGGVALGGVVFALIIARLRLARTAGQADAVDFADGD
jgi:MFS family permease